jgi:hypothetical protein
MEKTRHPAPGTTADVPDEDLRGRCCKTCAVSLAIKSAQGTARICRLWPPEPVELPARIAGEAPRHQLSQGPVFDNHVCWQWRPAGSLPGETYADTTERQLRAGLKDIGDGRHLS